MRYWIQSFCEDKGYKEIFIENDAGHMVGFLTFGARNQSLANSVKRS